MPILVPPESIATTTSPTISPPLVPTTTTSSTTSTSSTSTTSTTSPTTTSTSTSATTPTSTTSSTSSSVITTTSALTTSTSSTSSTSSVPAATTSTTGGAGAGVLTVTSTQLASSTSSAAPTTANSPSTSRGFFQNRGAVAGVFTVVGLIAAVLLIVLIVNFYRRRQAEKFDREIAEAAAEAAAARAPAFLDDENDHYGSGAGGTFAGKYSDMSHGTYSQPPMSESYNMREMGPNPGEVYDPNMYGGATGVGVGAGAAGIGVARARSRRDFAAGLQEGASPYAAFAGPQYNEIYNTSRSPPPEFRSTGSPERGLLEAAGLGSGDPRVQRGPSQQTHQTSYGDLSRNRSQGGFSSEAGHSSNHSQSYQPLNLPITLQPGVQRNVQAMQNTGVAYSNEDHEENIPVTPLPNPFSAASESHEHHGEEAESEEEEEEPRRVLRVANE